MIEDSSFPKGHDKSTPYPSIGTTLGEYRLEQLLEQSEFGPDFLARNNATGTMFRLRLLTLPSDLSSEERIVYLGHFQQQANQVTELQHVYILPLLDYGTYSGSPYLVYPYLPAMTLSTYLAQHKPMDAQLAGHYLDQLADALEYAHSHAMLHRNLTTDCIFMKQDSNLLIADFGLVRLLELSRPHGKGTLRGIAPEQMPGKPVDTYTDVYALGAVLYRMLTGHRVFRGSTPGEIAQQHLHAPVPSLGKWRKDLPAALDNVIAVALAKDPLQRYRQPGALANAYSQIVAPTNTQRKPFTITSRPALIKLEVAPRKPQSQKTGISRRHTLRLLVAGGGAAAAIAAVAVFGSRYLQLNNAPTSTTGAVTGTTPPATGSSTPAAQQGRVLARTSDIPLNSDKQFALAGSNNPGLLIHLPDNRFVAFDSTCTHAGCAVSYNPQDKLLQCPCHGAVYDPARNAAVVQGPAQSPLTSISITVEPGGTIVANS